MTHYVAVVQIERVEPGVEPQPDQYNAAKLVGGKPRVVTEEAKLVVRADTLDDLKDKITAHVALV